MIARTKKLIKGTPTAVLVSIALHGLLLFLAAGWVIFTIVEKQAQKFVPQKIERPKMQLKKLRVRVKESAKPRKAVERITAGRRTASMPDIQLPEMTGMGGGLERGISGFEMMADLSQMTILGAGRSVGNDLEGTFYYFPWDRTGNPIPGMVVANGALEPPEFVDAMNRFLANDWDPSVWSKYYRAPEKLYATQFMVPPCGSYTAPRKFGIKEADDPKFKACLWAIHYKGKIAHKTGGRFRFWGHGDDVLFVRIDGEIVLQASHDDRSDIRAPEPWKSEADEHRVYPLGNSHARVGDWFTLLPGVPVEMEVLVSEVPGGIFDMILLVQEEGVDYPENEQGMPILPFFKTMEPPPHIIDEIKYTLIPGQADLDGGPVFSTY